MGRAPRIIAGSVVLLALAIVSVLLIPPYVANWRMQSYVNDLVDYPTTAKQPPGVVRAQVLNEAAGLGLPVRAEDVSVGITQGAVKIDVLYIVHVDIAGYTVDLHFRPAAGN